MAFAVFRDVIEYLSKPGKDGYSDFDKLTVSPILQFGTNDDPYLLQTLLPEVVKSKNQYSEGAIEYISGLAAAGSSYAPTEINKGGSRVGMFNVNFGFTNQKDVLDVATYEAIHDILMLSDDSANMNNLEQAGESVLDWTANHITKPQMDLNELYRSQAIVDAKVERRGANGYAEDVIYPNGVGQRVSIPGGTVAAPGGWYKNDASYDPLQDFLAIQSSARKMGLEIIRVISDFDAKAVFMRSPAVKAQFFGIAMNAGSGGSVNVSNLPQVIDEDAVDALLRRYRLPAWELYDKTYNFLDSNNILQSRRFLDRVDDTGKAYDPVIIHCRTRRNLIITLPAPIGQVNLTNTLGYYGIGRCVGHENPGRVLNRLLEDKLHPPSFTAEILQEGLPVIQSPESFFILKVYKPTP